LKPKIAVVLNAAWNIYNFRLPLMRFLRDSGYDVIAIAPKDGYEERIKAEGFEFYDIELCPKGTNPIKDLKTVFALFGLYKKLQPVVVLHYTAKPNIYGNFAAFLANVPAVNTVTGLGTLFLSDSLSLKIGRFLYRLAFLSSAKVLFQNPDDMKLFFDTGLVKPEKTGLVHGSGIDESHFYYSKKEHSGSPFVFLLVARMLKDKGVLEFVEAARELKGKGYNAVFRLIGSAEAKNPTAIGIDEITEWEKEGVVEYMGQTDDVRSAIVESDCVVLPSYREGLPRTLLEAASMGRPMVATDAPGCRELVFDGVNGFLCKIKDSKDLSLAMEKMLLASDEERTAMGHYSREMICDKFSSLKIAEAYFETIKKIS